MPPSVIPEGNRVDIVELNADEAAVAQLVEHFYERIRAEPRLGAIFTSAVKDWPAHMQVMRDFWSRVLLNTERYNGCVMSAHFGLPVAAADLDRFLVLFRQTAAETLPPALADQAVAAVQSVNQGLGRMVQHAARAGANQ
jgi:hemoglobin